MEDPEYRVYIRIPVPRPAGFVDPPAFAWNAEKERMLWKTISRGTRGDINCTQPNPTQPSPPLHSHRVPTCLSCSYVCSTRLMSWLGNELAGVFQVDVPFLLQQAQFLYEKQLEELQLQMQRVNSSTSLLGQSKGIPSNEKCILMV
jgi:hypothetical protein